MTEPRLWRKLMTTFMLLGLVNIIFAFTIYYFSSINLLEQRSRQQMASVRALTSDRLISYFDSLKDRIEKGHISKITELEKSYVVKSDSDIAQSRFASAENDRFIFRAVNKVFVFNNSGLINILNQREGLGRTGEIYLVGEDGKLKSPSRHMQKTSGVRVDNESIKRGHEIVRDYRNVEVVSSYSNFHYDDLKFVLLSEIDKLEVFQPLHNTFPRSLILTAGVLLATALLSLLSTRQIVEVVNRMREQINGLNFKVLTAQEEEKRRIALDLHDGVGQSLTALKWSLAAMKDGDLSKLPQAIKLSEEAVADIRDVSLDLMPSSLKELGCYSAIREYLQRQEESHQIKVSFWFSQQLEEMTFKEGMDVNIYRMVQELVQNATKHAKATTLSLVILKQEDNFIIRFEDDGIGMDDSLPMPRTLSFRTQMMRGEIARESQQSKLAFIITTSLKNVFL